MTINVNHSYNHNDNSNDNNHNNNRHHHPHPHPHHLPTSSTSSTASSSTSVAGRIVCDGNGPRSGQIRAAPSLSGICNGNQLILMDFLVVSSHPGVTVGEGALKSLSEIMNEIVLNSNIGGIHGITWVYPADFSFEPPGIKAQTKDLYLEMPISFMKPWVTLAISRPRSRSKHRPNVTCSIGMAI